MPPDASPLVERARITGGAVLVRGSAEWAPVAALAACGVRIESASPETTMHPPTPSVAWALVQLDPRFGVVAVAPDAASTPEQWAAAVHCAVQHTVPGGLLVVPDDLDDAVAQRFDLSAAQGAHLEGGIVVRRTERYTIHDMVFDARSRIRRVSASELCTRLVGDRPPLALDTRTHTDRARFGVIPGSVHAPRTVLEWHLDPANGYRHPAVSDLDQPLVVVCNGGYSSSLAAANLTALGFSDVADLIGGHHAWVAAGLPVTDADHSHLDL
jgi:rhodanese-related sulfurtransferase